MAQESKRSERGEDSYGDASSDETTQLKKRARRRLIGAIALALLAVIVLPMVMDHQPAPSLKDIQVRIPSPDEGLSQRVAPKPIAPRKDEKTTLPAEPVAVKELPLEKIQAKPEPKPQPVAEGRPESPKAEAKPESKPEAKAEPKKIEPKPEAKPEPKTEAPVARSGDDAWEVQLGAYQEPGRVKLLLGKLKELGVPSYTEKVDTPNGTRTRVRAGPFPSQDAAEKARARIKIIGVDGPVARKP